MRDSFDRDIRYLRISVTDRCDLACRYCRAGDPFGRECAGNRALLGFDEIVRIVEAGAGLGIDKVRLTGGEPLLRPGLPDLVKRIKGIDGIRFVGLTTNGTLLARQAGPLRYAGLDGVNVSLDTLDPEVYREITGGGDIARVMAGLAAVAELPFSSIKINMVVSPETPEKEIGRMADFCSDRGFTLQRIREYRLDSREDNEHDYERPLRCGDCNRLRLTADGKLLPCLHSDREIPVDFEDIAGSLARAAAAKPRAGESRSVGDVSTIGG